MGSKPLFIVPSAGSWPSLPFLKHWLRYVQPYDSYMFGNTDSLVWLLWQDATKIVPNKSVILYTLFISKLMLFYYFNFYSSCTFKKETNSSSLLLTDTSIRNDHLLFIRILSLFKGQILLI
jgi:hypothetical protein